MKLFAPMATWKKGENKIMVFVDDFRKRCVTNYDENHLKIIFFVRNLKSFNVTLFNRKKLALFISTELESFFEYRFSTGP